jgi:hypothetical protein
MSNRARPTTAKNRPTTAALPKSNESRHVIEETV